MPVFCSGKYYNWYHHIYTVSMIDSVPVCPIRKLLQYSHRQGHGDTHHHIVGSYPRYHPYCSSLYKCMHIMHDSNLGGTFFHSCSTVPYHVKSLQCTMIQYTSPSYFETKLSQMPYQHTWLSYYAATYTTHIMPMAEQYSTLVVHFSHAGAASKSNVVWCR